MVRGENMVGVVVMACPTEMGLSGEARMTELTERLASRMGAPGRITSAFLSAGASRLMAAVLRLKEAGAVSVVVIPCQLFPPPEAYELVRWEVTSVQAAMPNFPVRMEWPEPTERRLEDQLFDKLWPLFTADRIAPGDGAAIERESRRILDRTLEVAARCFAADDHEVVRRILHASADFSFIDNLYFTPDAVTRGVEALRAGAPVICDVRMLMTGCTHACGEALCAIGDPETKELAKAKGMTRAAAAMVRLAGRMDGAVVAVGNAPTALWKIIELTRAPGGPRPAVIVGLPVGMVGAFESKRDLSLSGLPCITNLSPRGGSPVAAAAVNAMADMAHRINSKEGDVV